MAIEEKNIPRLLFRNARYKNALYILYRYCCYSKCFLCRMQCYQAQASSISF